MAINASGWPENKEAFHECFKMHSTLLRPMYKRQSTRHVIPFLSKHSNRLARLACTYISMAAHSVSVAWALAAWSWKHGSSKAV
jgi:hypothetical protein